MSDMQQEQAQQHLAERLAALPREFEPTRDLWPDIASAITPRPRQRLFAHQQRWVPLALAASLVLVFSSTLGGAWLGYDYALRSQVQAPVPTFDLAGIEHSYAIARASYLRDITLGQHPLDAPARQALSENLATIDEALHSLRSAMARDPQNAFYLEALLMTREQEMDLLADYSSQATTRL